LIDHVDLVLTGTGSGVIGVVAVLVGALKVVCAGFCILNHVEDRVGLDGLSKASGGAFSAIVLTVTSVCSG